MKRFLMSFLIVALDVCASVCIGYGLRMIWEPLMWIFAGAWFGYMAVCAAKLLH